MNVIQLKESFTNYSVTIELHYSDSIPEIDSKIDSLIKNVYHSPVNFEFIIEGDYQSYIGTNVDELKSAIREEEDYWTTEDTKANIYISVNKSKSNEIINEEAISSSLQSYEVPVQLELIKKNIINSISLVGWDLEKSEYLSSISKDKYNSDITPFHLNKLIQSGKYGQCLIDYFSSLRTILSFAMLAEHVEFDRSEMEVFISNDVTFSLNRVKKYTKTQNQVVYNIFLWCFEDDAYRLRASVFNTVLSVQANPDSSLDHTLLPILKSNFNILLQDKFESYLEARSTVFDFIFELSNKLKEQVMEQKSAFNNTLMAVLSFLFTSIVFTTIDKGKFINVFTTQINILVSIFILGALIYINIKQKDIEEVLTFHLKQRDEFKRRYRETFSKEELDSIFEPDSLKTLIAKINSRNKLYLYQAYFLIINVTVFIIHFFKV
ncbi:hypothetical protein NOK89_23840 [Vibrio parahaemolyticus]|uniref:hypothetical protein n=1 Tax=Vibrio parahaemolyticus TaxID=670 RepID=UPI00226B55AC|nr:hypothetical protein [Vibrio parahaemolyticus]MCX8885238.1 hypothetical protein [Vibrio parahaemolyticus]